MPYEGEYAQYRSIRRITQSERVHTLLGSFRVRHTGPLQDPHDMLEFGEVESTDWVPSLAIAVDGSHVEVDVENGFPGAEASYVTVACVFLDIAKMRCLDQSRPINPIEYRATQQTESMDCAFPGCNIVYHDESSAIASLRRTVFDELLSKRVFSDSETLLDTYEAVLVHKPIAAHEQKCPHEDCPLVDSVYLRGAGQYQCTCAENRTLYSTDAMRIHEGMNPVGKNGAMFAEIMQVFERLWVVHTLRALEARGWLSTLRRLAIVMDGPLAVFGHPAWLSQAISKELFRLNAAARKVNGGQDILLLGVEKTGAFAMHLNALDQTSGGRPGQLPNRKVALISDGYIKRNIVPSDSTKPYGQDTYFGRKFFYKTRTGALIVGSLPVLEEDHRDSCIAEPWQYPRLADALTLLDDLFCSRYPNSVMPLVAAHSEAAIPLNLGKKILEQLAKELLSEQPA